MRVLLANPPWTVNGIKGVKAGSRWPHLKIPEEEDYMPFPFFLAYAASLLKKNGIDILLIDAIAEGISDTKFLAKIKDYKPNIVLLEVSTPSLKTDLEWALKIKKLENSIKIAFAGLDMNIRDPKFLEKNGFIDFVLVGEYEFTLLGLVNCLKNKDKLSKVPGLIYRDKGRIIINKNRPLGDINKLPWPLREQLPMHKYHDCPGGIPQPSVQVLASRGCPYNCIFCAWPQIMYHGSNYRVRDPIDVVDEMEFLVKKKGFKSVYFDDDTFNIGRERMLKICDEIKKRKLKIPWAIMARADIMDKELLDEMKSAGLYAVKYGIESAVQKLVDNANKDLDLKKTEEIIRYTNKIGIKTHLTFMFGLPGETHETIQKTIDFALRMNPESVQFSITTPFPGTSYYKELDKKGMLVSKKWSDYDGNFRSVIKTRELSAKDLENAVRIAYNTWAEHRQRRIKDKKSSLIVLKKCLDEHGPKYTAKKIMSKVFKKKDISKKKQEQKRIPKKNLILKNFYDNRLDLIGVVDGKHAFIGPNLVQIDLTNKCNNSCIGCWCNSPLLKEKKLSGREKEATLPYSRVIDLIGELKNKLGTKEIYLGGGGEPFMHSKIIEIVEHIKRNKLVCHINTNFTLINEEIAKKLVELKVDHIAASLWVGDAETYVKTHPNQTNETFYQIEKILKFIKKLKNEKNEEKPLIKIYNVISSLNYEKINEMVEFAYRIADSIEFSVIDVVEGKTDSLLLNEKQRKELLKKSLELKEKYKNKRDFIIFRFDQFIKRISNPLSVKGMYDKKAVDSIPCYVGWTFSRILANGDVIPCLKAHKKPMGNILKKNFKEIFFSEEYNKFRFMAKNFKKNDEFFNCINCYKTCDDLGRNNEMYKGIKSLNSNEKKILNYAKDLRIIKGIIDFLKNKKIKTSIYEKERKKILDNFLNWDIKKISSLTKKLKKEINFYEFYTDIGMSESSYIKVVAISSKKRGLLELKESFEEIKGMADFLNKKKIKIADYEKEQKKILDNILDWDVEKIDKKVNNLTKKLKKEVDFYGYYIGMGMNKRIYSKVLKIDSKKKELLKLRKSFEEIKGMADFLNKKKIKTSYYEKEQKKILDNILDWDIEKIDKKVNNLTKKLKKEVDFYGCCIGMGMNERIYSKVLEIDTKKKELLGLRKSFEEIKGMTDFLNKEKIKTADYEKERKNILDNILDWDIEKIKVKINQIHNKINKKINSVQIRWNKSKLNRSKLQQKIRKAVSKQGNNLDILLVMCLPWDTKMPPLGLAYLASNLKSKGVKTELVDINIELYNLAKNKYKGTWNGENYNDWAERGFHLKLFSEFYEYISKVLNFIITKQPSIVGLSVNASNINFSYEFVKRLKCLNTNLKICIGGPNTNPVYILDHKIMNYIDFVIVGEADYILPELISSTKNGRDVNNSLETFLSREGVIFIKAKPLNNIDIISAPTFSEFDLSKYEEDVLPMLTSRGCLNRCNFCTDWMGRKCYSLRSTKKIIEELEYHIKYNKIRRFSFCDLIINGNLKHLEKICDLIIKREIKIEWTAQGSVNQKMDNSFLRKIKFAGCTSLVFGVESCSNKVLKSMNKPFKVEHLKLLLKQLKKAGIGGDINLIIGYPGEDKEEFEETYDFIDKYHIHINSISSLTPCLILGDSWISENTEKFNIIIPKSKEGYLKWYNIEGTNTYEIRKKRIKKIVELANYHGIKTPLVNLYDEKSSINKPSTKSIESFSPKNTNSNVLLVICPPWGIEMPPLGLAYLASSLEREGFTIQIFDLNIELYNVVEDSDQSLWNMSNYLKWTKFKIHNKLYRENAKLLNQFYKLIERVKPLSICFSVNISNYNSSLGLIKEIKRKFPESKMGVGGPNIDEDYFMKSEMKDHVDFAVIGEGEIVLPKVLNQIKHGLPIEKIEGILIPSKFDQKRINVSHIIKDLDFIPFPTYKGFPLKKYTQRILPILSSRGCIRRCAYCSDWKMGREYRVRSAENIFEEIKYHVSHNNIKNFDFKDLLINGDINVLNILCDLIIDSGLKLGWSGQGTIKKDMTFDLLKKMKKSGFFAITYGVESFSDNILRKMKKGVNKETINKVLCDTYKAGIKIQINLIIGFPGETKKDFRETIEGLRKNAQIISSISSLLPLSIYGNSDIELNPDSYGISYPKNINFSKWLNKRYNLFWKDDKGIGFEERMSRLKRIMNLLDELNIPYPAFDFDAINKVTNNIRKNNKMETNYDSYLVVKRNLIKVFFERLKGK